MELKRRILATVVVLSSLGAQAAQDLRVSYHCVSSNRISFSSGDGKWKEFRTQEIQWSPEVQNNLNLVIGEQKALIWVRQPFGTDERFLTIFRSVPGRGYVADSVDIEMGRVGQESMQSLDFSFEDSLVGRTEVRCQIRM